MSEKDTRIKEILEGEVMKREILVLIKDYIKFASSRYKINNNAMIDFHTKMLFELFSKERFPPQLVRKYLDDWVEKGEIDGDIV